MFGGGTVDENQIGCCVHTRCSSNIISSRCCVRSTTATTTHITGTSIVVTTTSLFLLLILIFLVGLSTLETNDALQIQVPVVWNSLQQHQLTTTGRSRLAMSISGNIVEILQGEKISDDTCTIASEMSPTQTTSSDVIPTTTGTSCISSFPPLRILDQNEYYMIIDKPPSVVCHHSPWTGSRRKQKKLVLDDINNHSLLMLPTGEIPILQRVREQTSRRVNLVHRLDRGSSGCLLLTYAEPQQQQYNYDDDDDDNDNYGITIDRTEENTDTTGSTASTTMLPPLSSHEPLDLTCLPNINSTRATAILSEALADKMNCTKTYIAIVRGEGILHGEDLKERGWFLIDRPIKNENGIEKNATTYVRFIAGQDNGAGTIDRPRASIVLARPQTGRWHQIRKHLNGLSHPILGDTTHGSSRTNREWKELRNMPSERTCLHLSQLIIGAQPEICPNGINVTCPLASDMMQLLNDHLPTVLATAIPILHEEGILL